MAAAGRTVAPVHGDPESLPASGLPWPPGHRDRVEGRKVGARVARLIREVAAEVRTDWRKPYFGAVPYLDAMGALDTMADSFYLDSADDIVRYFLANAHTWRGETARRVKAELNGMLAGK